MKHERLVKAALGDHYEGLMKAIVKQDTESVVDIDELTAALRIAPKSVVLFLMKHLPDMKDHESKEIELPFGDTAKMLINKDQEDVYHGHFEQKGKITHKFDLVSIPQLAAHILSHFELYDESPILLEQDKSDKLSDEVADPEETIDTASEDHKKESYQEKFKRLEDKIDALFRVVAKEEEIKKSEAGKSLKKNLYAKILKKAGMMPKMPSPPKPGSNVGGMNGIAQTGVHSPKTAVSDGPRSKPKMDLGASKAKETFNAAKQSAPKAIKSELTVKKAEVTSKCVDCGGSLPQCACFQILSAPDIKKSENTVTYKFNSDWNKESVAALYRALHRRK